MIPPSCQNRTKWPHNKKALNCSGSDSEAIKTEDFVFVLFFFSPLFRRCFLPKCISPLKIRRISRKPGAACRPRHRHEPFRWDHGEVKRELGGEMRGLAHLAALVCFQPAASSGKSRGCVSFRVAGGGGQKRQNEEDETSKPSEQTSSENDS